MALLLVKLKIEERESKGSLSVSRKKTDDRSQLIDVCTKDVVLVIDVLRPIDNVSPTRLGVRQTPGKEKKDVI
jgi:hypothetical protein